ncbi:hypothetical protein Q0Z83_035690 [Actinoplanes sichuanensis]|uniref:Cellulose binding domain-containing protein n=1 Tax=Actinoplanes sichuanensis TaxID=512349 RepID=A0ABW4ABG7_9ACTN|nr:cellulose binding domain-containing protein [Actinoplanes sichuanensis]BEL05378.1 hypothetical protein Q0Z83_035690 [Actinoplanes sichuanensis]
MDVVRDTAWRIATAALTSPSPEPRVRTARTPRERSTAGRFMLVFGALAAVALTALLVVMLVIRPYQESVKPEEAAGLPDRPAAPAVPSSAATTSATITTSRAARPSTSPSRAADIAGSPSPSAVTSQTPAPLAAAYTTTPYVIGLLGYRTEVTVTNPGPATRDGWTLTVTLPRETLWINQVSGATVTQQKAVWTFVPDAKTTAIPAGQQVTISFEVHGATLIDAAPTACRIDDTPCTG